MKFFKGYLPQISLGSFLNILTQLDLDPSDSFTKILM